MSSELSLLIPAFRKEIIALIAACKARSVVIEPLVTIVSPTEQGSKWQQGRTPTDAELKVMALDKANAHFLASCIRDTKARETRLVTDALPGFSWHQWGEAVTFVWVDSIGKLNWSIKTIDRQTKENGYMVLAEEAKKLGLTHGSLFLDLDHNWGTVQLRPEATPAKVYNVTEIDAEMKKRFQK